jgi:hypothetical protein
MIASFRKANFFMSTWGVERYRERGSSFMREAIERYRPVLLLINRGELDPESARFRWLLPEDQKLIQQFYVPYWGPIWVAGVQADVPEAGSLRVAVPFPGRYRLEAKAAVRIDDVTRAPGESFEITARSCVLSDAGAATPLHASLVWAEAGPPPDEAPPRGLYAPL